jgi:hypothetical protein
MEPRQHEKGQPRRGTALFRVATPARVSSKTPFGIMTRGVRGSTAVQTILNEALLMTAVSSK